MSATTVDAIDLAERELALRGAFLRVDAFDYDWTITSDVPGVCEIVRDFVLGSIEV